MEPEQMEQEQMEQLEQMEQEQMEQLEQMEQEQMEQLEHRARAMRLKMNEKGMWRWALRGIVIQ
jgi:hypothetical protein